MTLIKLRTCTHCGHRWLQRTKLMPYGPELLTPLPRKCPSCGSPNWHSPRRWFKRPAQALSIAALGDWGGEWLLWGVLILAWLVVWPLMVAFLKEWLDYMKRTDRQDGPKT